jgi:hypothetical protein
MIATATAWMIDPGRAPTISIFSSKCRDSPGSGDGPSVLIRRDDAHENSSVAPFPE